MSAAEIAKEKNTHFGIMAYLSQYVKVNTTKNRFIEYNTGKHVNHYTSEPEALNSSMRSDYGHYHRQATRIISDGFSDESSRDNSITSSGIHDHSFPNSVLSGVAYDYIRSSNDSLGGYQDFSSSLNPKQQMDTYSVGIIFDRTINGNTRNKESVVIEARSPSGRLITFSGETNYTAKFEQAEIGKWNVKILYDGRTVDDSEIFVCDPSKVQVKATNKGVVGEPVRFRVNCLEAGTGDLSLEFYLGGKRVPVRVDRMKKHVLKAEFTPQSPGTYRVKILYNGVEIKDVSKILSPKPIIRRAVFKMNITEDDDIVKVKLVCDWKIDYETGTSFQVKIETDPDVRIIDNSRGTMYNNVELMADCNNVGDGVLEATVTYNDRTVPVEVFERHPRMHVVKFTPEAPGTYKTRLFYDGREAKCSPYIQIIEALDNPKASGEGLYHAQENIPASFDVDPYGQKGNLAIVIKGPNTILHPTISLNPSGHYDVRYKPSEMGKHTISINWNDEPVEGSPFHPRVVNPDKVRVNLGSENPFIPTELQPNNKLIVPLRVGRQKELEFHTENAGPGELNAEVFGPTKKVPVIVDSPNKNTQIISFTPREEGPHEIDVTWSGFPLPYAPYQGYATNEPITPPRSTTPTLLTVPTGSSFKRPITPSSPSTLRSKTPNHPKVILRGHGLKEAKVGRTATFTIDGTEADSGEPMVQITGYDQQNDIVVKTRPVAENFYKCEYIPEKPGAYLLNICWNGRQLKGAPFKVNVRGSEYNKKTPPVDDILDMLKNTTVGRDISLRLNPQLIGSGLLTAYCTGPTGPVPCHVKRNPDSTQSIKVTPKEPGKHILHIKYNDHHVMGSPYELEVGVSHKKGEVMVSGPGLENGILHHYNSNFLVNTTNAGSGELKVSIMGPRGAFKTEMHRNSPKDKIFSCYYCPEEAGMYTIHVKWSGVDVKGSPFTVVLAENESDLGRMLLEQSIRSHDISIPEILY